VKLKTDFPHSKRYNSTEGVIFGGQLRVGQAVLDPLDGLETELEAAGCIANPVNELQAQDCALDLGWLRNGGFGHPY
jgi:hypothetical protein